ncbi:MAG: filamentous hemagglutinin, partial [Cyanobacteria bacterium J06635_13]
ISTINAGIGNSGDIEIDVVSLAITAGGSINSGISSSGNGGNTNINAEESISVIGNTELFSFISAGVGFNSTAQAGNITIETPQLTVQDATIAANVFGAGNGGNININAAEQVSVISRTESRSSISANISAGATGEAGNINIETTQLVLQGASVSADVIGNGEGGTVDILAVDSIGLSNASLIQAEVFAGSTGNGGNLNISTGKLTLDDGSTVSATTLGEGNAGNVTINANDSINLSGVNEFSRGGIFASALIEDGDSGNIDLTTGELTISDGAIIAASNFPSFGADSASTPGTGEPGNITIAADSINLESEGRIEAITQASTGTGANIDLQVADTISLTGNSFVSAQAFGSANGGNLDIDTNFIVAFPDGNNDIIASAAQGQGGNINIVAESLLGIEERPLNPFTNDINASSEFGLDGDISIDVPDVNPLQGAAELPVGTVVADEITAQGCSTKRDLTAKSGLSIDGRGGVPPAPDLPMSSGNVIADNEIKTISVLPQPLATSRGKIQPARGIRVTKKGQVILTPYRTDNKGDRLIDESQSSCGLRTAKDS